VQLRVTPDKRLSEKRPDRIDQNIADSGFPHRHKRLVPLVKAGIADRNRQCNKGPSPSPAVALTANPVEHGNTEDPEFRHMCELSNCGVHPVERVKARGRKDPMQKWRQDFGSFLAAEIVG